MKQFQHNPAGTPHISRLEEPQFSAFGEAKGSLYLKHFIYKLQANISFLLGVHNASSRYTELMANLK